MDFRVFGAYGRFGLVWSCEPLYKSDVIMWAQRME
jgi:hypothetical protein